MGKIATLRTDAAKVEFLLLSADKPNGDGLFRLSMSPRLSSVNFGDPLNIRLFHSDLLRLTAYLEGHIEQLGSEGDPDSIIFAPLELGFQLQALEGEFHNPMDGYFSVVFSARYILPDVLGGVYYGFEGTLDLTDAYSFCAELRELALAIGGSS